MVVASPRHESISDFHLKRRLEVLLAIALIAAIVLSATASVRADDSDPWDPSVPGTGQPVTSGVYGQAGVTYRIVVWLVWSYDAPHPQA